MRLFSYIARKLWSGKVKNRVISAPVVKIAIGSIALGMAVMILTLSIVTGFKNEIRNRAIGFAGHIVVIAYNNNNSFEQEPVSVKADFLKNISSNAEIKHIQPYATKNAIIKTNNENQGIILKGVDKNYDWKFIKQYLREGAIPVYNDSISSDKILVSQTIAGKLNIKTGDKLVTYFVSRKNNSAINNYPDSVKAEGYEQRVRKFEVSGIYQTGFADVDDNVVFADLKQIQRLNYWSTDEAGGFEIELNNFDKVDEMTEYLNGEVGQGLEARSIKGLYPTLFSWLDLLDSNAIIIIVLMIAVSIINMISALLILILERSNTIGILKALGANDGLMQKVFLYQSGKMLAIGLLLGNIIGLAFVFLQMKFKMITLNPETYYVSFVPVELHGIPVILINILTITCCLVMMLLPVLIISKITPVKTIRFK
ncbi:MAG: ABC transporter permease [Bacteroidia bacterium]